MKRIGILILQMIFVSSMLSSKTKENVDYINPLIGASTSMNVAKAEHGLGKTFPGATTPFGLVQLSPDTMTGGDNGSGYSWHHRSIEGFSFTHMSGIGWYGDFGNLLTMATTGKLHTSKGTPPPNDLEWKNNLQDRKIKGYRSFFRHENEIAQAGYYSVFLDDYNIKAELTAARRAGIIRFTYPASKDARIQIDLARRIGGSSTEQFVEIVNKNTIRGWMKCDSKNGGWGDGKGGVNYTVYFYAQFSKPLENVFVWEAKIPEELKKDMCNNQNSQLRYQEIFASATVRELKDFARGEHIGFFTEFETKEHEQVLMKAGISFVSMKNAEENLNADIAHWDFEKVRKNARMLWAEAISKMEVCGATETDKAIFFTALYHALIDPRIVSDNNGEYFGADGKIYKTDDYNYRTIFSGWDVFRSEFPLLTIIYPDVVNDQINTFIELAEKTSTKHKGMLPRWEIMNSYSGCMLGDPAISVICDAYAKGIKNYNIEKAFALCKKTSLERDGTNKDFHKYGYVPNQVSHTLELAYTQWCTGRLAELLGKTKDANFFYSQSKNYKNIWDSSKNIRWFRAKAENGQWLEYKGKTTHNQGCTESNNYQQGWFVPHDICGLKTLMGEDFFLQELENFFEKTPKDFLWNNYYNHPNEPNHHVPFMFNYTSKPYLTQKWTRKICQQAYGNDVMGLVGNDDVGQMSAWYVLAASGIHPVCPGATRYEITSPVFDKITIRLNNNYYAGKFFKIIAHNNSKENIYIQSIKLNGKKLNRLYIDHNEITQGGTLELFMGKDIPNYKN